MEFAVAAGMVLLILQGHWFPVMIAACLAILARGLRAGTWVAFAPLIVVAVASPVWSDVPLLSNLGAASWCAFGLVVASWSAWGGRGDRALKRRVFRWTLLAILWIATLYTIGAGVAWMLDWPMSFGWRRPVFPVKFRPFGFHGATQLAVLIAMCFSGIDDRLARLRTSRGKILSASSRILVVLALVWADSRAAWIALAAVGMLRGGQRTGGLLLPALLGTIASFLLDWLPVLDASSRGTRLGWGEHLVPLLVFISPLAGNRLKRLSWTQPWAWGGAVAFPVMLPIVVLLAKAGHEFVGGLTTGRTAFWSAAWHVFERMPLVGAGAWSYTRAYLDSYGLTLSFVPMHAHNLPLQILVDFGLLGGVAGLLAIGAVWRLSGFRRLDPAIAVLMVLWVQSATDVPGSEVLWLAGLALGVLEIRWNQPWSVPRWGAILVVLGALWVGARGMFPADRESALLRGSIAWESGASQEAEVIWEDAGVPEANRAALLSRFARGLTGPDWIVEADRAAEQAPWHPLLAAARMHVWGREGRFGKADSLLDVQIARWPTTQIYWIGYLRYSTLGDSVRANRCLAAAMERDPSVAGLGTLPFSSRSVDSLLRRSSAFQWSQVALARMRQGDTVGATQACRIGVLALPVEPFGPPPRCALVLGKKIASYGGQPIRHAAELHEVFAFGAAVPKRLEMLAWRVILNSGL